MGDKILKHMSTLNFWKYKTKEKNPKNLVYLRTRVLIYKHLWSNYHVPKSLLFLHDSKYKTEKRKITQFKRQIKSSPVPRVLTVHRDNKIKRSQRTKTNAWLHTDKERSNLRFFHSKLESKDWVISTLYVPVKKYKGTLSPSFAIY